MVQLQRMCVGLFLVVVVFSQGCDGTPPCFEPHDLTKSDCKNGSDVVDAVFAKLDCLEVFNDSDHILMRRIAYVETEYGKSENYVCNESGGGIWRLERDLFDELFQPHVQNILRNASDKIYHREGTSFFDIEYKFLKKPFYSGLAARLYLYYLELTWGRSRVPFNGSIEEQAKFWVNNYAKHATEEYFIYKASGTDNKCTINADVLFLVDTSGSILEHNFKRVREFLLNFVEELRIGPQDDQVGVVTFSANAKVEFSLNEHNTLTDLNNAIQNIHYRRGTTNLRDGLCHLIEGFTKEENGVRPSSAIEVYRVAIILSDGLPNEYTTNCNFTTHIEGADRLRELSVRAYVIGVTDGVDDSVLKGIAFDKTDEYYRHLDTFDDLPDAYERYRNDICKRASIQAEKNQTLNATLDENENIRIHFNISESDSGITVEFCVSEGHIRVYGSVTISNPNSAFYNWMFEVKHDEEAGETCLAYFFNTTSGATSSSDPTTDYEALLLTDQTLYISVEGVEDHNRFILNGVDGNNCDETNCVNTNVGVTPSPTPSPSPPGPEVPTVVAAVVTAVMSGLVVVILFIFIFFLVRGFYVHRRNKKREKEDEYSLLSENIDYVSFQ